MDKIINAKKIEVFIDKIEKQMANTRNSIALSKYDEMINKEEKTFVNTHFSFKIHTT